MDQLEVIVAKRRNGYRKDVEVWAHHWVGPVRPKVWMHQWVELPDEKVFHVVITDQEVVDNAREIISAAEHRVAPDHGHHLPHGPDYFYYFRFATDDLTTLVYSGSSNESMWHLDDTAVTTWVPSPVDPPLSDLMNTLHDRFGMPYWLAPDGEAYTYSGGQFYHVEPGQES
jgi:hypothetical protein